ncbi:MAG TPA: PEP-CTERM sorting domain-containing protein [Candidatus Tectomicrobia bacterium]|jgi:hypothetical protein
MLKKLLSCTGALVTVLGLTGMVQASALHIFTDIVDPEPDAYLSVVPAVYTYSHSILDEGFEPLAHHLHGANLTLDIYDDSSADKRERVTVELDGQNYGTFVITGSLLNLTVDPALVQDDGLLQVTLLRSKGDFLFNSSTLVAHAPEPSTLFLLGSGLVGLVGMNLRRRQQGVRA